jgi:DNA-binding transcriptional ArsR family regulator
MDWLPSSDVDQTQDGAPRVIGVDDEGMDEVLDALSSDTARTILSEIYADPATPSELRDRTDLSLQTISYHLSNLEAADVIQVAGTEYSEKGREMNIYAPADEPVVVFVGTQERKSGLLDLVKRVLSAGVILLASTAYVFSETFGLSASPGGGTGGSGVFTTPFITFFLGGLVVLYVFIAWGLWAELRS